MWQRGVRDYGLAQVHAHCEGVKDHENDYMMDPLRCNDAGSKVNESNRVPLEQRRLRVVR